MRGKIIVNEVYLKIKNKSLRATYCQERITRESEAHVSLHPRYKTLIERILS